MYSSNVGTLALCCLFLQGFTEVTGDLGTQESIAVGVSLGLTTFIVSFIGFFLCRALHFDRGVNFKVKDVDKDIPAETGSVNMEPPPYRYRYQNAFTETGSFHMETSPSPAHYQIVSHVWRAEKNILWTQLKLTEEGHFGFWRREKWNESQIFSSGLWLLYLVVCSETKRERLLRRLIFLWIDSLAIINQK